VIIAEAPADIAHARGTELADAECHVAAGKSERNETIQSKQKERAVNHFYRGMIRVRRIAKNRKAGAGIDGRLIVEPVRRRLFLYR